MEEKEYKEAIIRYMINQLKEVEVLRMKDLPTDILNLDCEWDDLAADWLRDGPGMSNAIKLIAEHDEYITPKVDCGKPSSVLNRFWEIIGSEILTECETYSQNCSDYHNEVVTEEMRQALIAELKQLIK